MSILQKRLCQINLLQDNLQIIRRLAGWTVEELGNKIGVTKQTISNLENKKTKMSFTQYIALRAVFECEIQENRENEILSEAIRLLIDMRDELDDRIYKEICTSLTAVAMATTSETNRHKLNELFLKMMSGSVSGFDVSLMDSAWLKRLDLGTWLKRLFYSMGEDKEEG